MKRWRLAVASFAGLVLVAVAVKGRLKVESVKVSDSTSRTPAPQVSLNAGASEIEGPVSRFAAGKAPTDSLGDGAFLVLGFRRGGSRPTERGGRNEPEALSRC